MLKTINMSKISVTKISFFFVVRGGDSMFRKRLLTIENILELG